ncbi:HD domain-containing phosphohydrolase [Lacipirellula sp.]|uniref:HD domain-containing phosphohydrolase n=1 Tax=Lacipirellula sp. TaxID=2691419 RepID=UPI003D0A1594
MSQLTAIAERLAPTVALRQPPSAVADATLVRECKLMVVDDEPTNVKIVRRLLELEGFSQFVTTTDGRKAMTLIRDEKPDCVLLDLMMPFVTGLDVLDEMRHDPATAHIPAIILTAVTDHKVRCEALKRGATDFLNKPVDPAELAPRVVNVLAAKAYQDQLVQYNHSLEAAVRERTRLLEQAYREIGLVLARAAEYRDNDTGLHVVRVGRYARIIGEELGIVGDDADLLERAAQLHDVGKIGIPDSILLKPGRLTDEEFELMKRHCAFGDRILQPYSGDEPQLEIGEKPQGLSNGGATPLLVLAHRIAMSHHEHWDGSGYPVGLAGEAIPLEGRITAVADVFDALSSKRCYKDSFPVDECFDTMAEKRGTQFDPRVMDAFLRRRDEVADVLMRYADEG